MQWNNGYGSMGGMFYFLYMYSTEVNTKSNAQIQSRTHAPATT